MYYVIMSDRRNNSIRQIAKETLDEANKCAKALFYTLNKTEDKFCEIHVVQENAEGATVIKEDYFDSDAAWYVSYMIKQYDIVTNALMKITQHTFIINAPSEHEAIIKVTTALLKKYESEKNTTFINTMPDNVYTFTVLESINSVSIENQYIVYDAKRAL